jgi:hypothetical protein
MGIFFVKQAKNLFKQKWGKYYLVILWQAIGSLLNASS